MAADCIEKTGATEDDVNGMCEKKTPSTKTGKCLAFCMMNQFNCVSINRIYWKDNSSIDNVSYGNLIFFPKINDKGEFQQEEFMDLMKMAVENETMLAMCDEVSKKCVDTKDPNNDK